MMGLLVSVRSAAEAMVALEGGVDVVDVKEPGRGALGAAEPGVWREILEVVGRRAIASAALGELMEEGVEGLARQAAGFRYAKVGLAGCGVEREWKRKWGRVVECLSAGVRAVPVAYADAVRASSPALAEVMELAEGCGGGMLLIDTFDKSGGGLLDFLSVDGLWAVCEEASERGVRVALAGSLNAAAIAKLVDVPAAYVGVRGAACIGGRDGTIDLACVKSLVALVRGRRQKMAS